MYALVKHMQAGDKIMPCSAPVFRRMFNQVTSALGLDGMNYKPYSARRGGATSHFKTYGSLDLTVERGRWLSSRTARLYIDDGLAVLAGQELTTMQTGLIAAARKYYV